MKLFYKIIFMSLIMATAQVKASEYEGDKDVCTSADFLNKTQLSCIACGLKKAGRPVPDDHFLGMMGLIVRESSALFPDETNPTYTKHNRRSINGLAGQTIETKSGQVDLTARAQMQKNVIQMLLSSGYCTQGKIKSKVKNTDYKNFIERMTSDKYAVTGDDKKTRDKAAKEIGQYNYGNAKEEFFLDAKDSSFFSMTFEQQQEFYKKRRTAAINRENDDTSYRSNTEISDCLTDIEQNYAPKYSSAADSYVACTAIYDTCEIATYNGSIKRKDPNGKEVRVGGDWCASKFNEKSTLAKPAIKLRKDGTPPAPVVDKSTKNLGTVYVQQNKVIVGPNGPEVDMSKIKYAPNGDIIIPKDAINPQEEVKVKVEGRQKPAATK